MTSTTLNPLTTGFGLLEGARWYEGSLIFSDMTGGGVHRMDGASGTTTTIIPHRKGIGGLVAHGDGGYVVSGRNVARKPDRSDQPTVVFLEPRPDEQFFNDLTADGHGRIYVGSVAKQPRLDGPPQRPGRLYRIDLDGSTTTLSSDVLTSNGLGLSPSGDVLYHVDSHRHVIWRFDLTSVTPSREVFADTSHHAGVPDGLAVASDGSIWIAQAGAGLVLAWDDAGHPIDQIEIPQDLVTSVTFGGEHLLDLYVLTGAEGDHPDPFGGAIYRMPASIAGLPAPVAAVRKGVLPAATG